MQGPAPTQYEVEVMATAVVSRKIKVLARSKREAVQNALDIAKALNRWGVLGLFGEQIPIEIQTGIRKVL